MNVHLYRVIYPVKDIEAAEIFYSKVLGQKGERVSPGRHYFNLGGTILACYDPVIDGDDIGDGWKFHENQYIYFGVDDLEARFEKVKQSNGYIDSGIEVMPWGERLFYARDPFGNPICFVDNQTLFMGAGN